METVHRNYVDATEAFVRGDAGKAVELLEATPEAYRDDSWRLALAKSCLALDRAEDARVLLKDAVTDERRDPGSRAYLLLLLAAALAGTGRTEEALARLEEVSGLDPRLERPARALERRVRAAEAPAVTL